MKIPREARRLCKDLFRLSMVNGRLDGRRVSQIADSLLQDKPRHYLQILKEFSRLVRLEVQKHHAVVDSAVALGESEQKGIESSLRARFGQDTSFGFRVTPGLIAGLRVKLGSNVWDGSVRGRLETLRQQF